MEIGEWLEELPYSDKSFKEKSVWVTMKGGGKLGQCLFSIPYSLMIPFADGDLYKKAVYRGKNYVKYRMTKGAHNSCTWGKKRDDGTRMFKSSRVYGTVTTGGGGVVGARTKGTKQYFCKNCRKNVDIERDNQNNAFCTDCGQKMFG